MVGGGGGKDASSMKQHPVIYEMIKEKVRTIPFLSLTSTGKADFGQ